jgi:hypothetical protein
MLNQLGSTLPLVLEEMTRLGQAIVLREWLPADGRGSRDGYLKAMLAARHRDGDDYLLQDPHAVALTLKQLGWTSETSIYEEPADTDPPILYPLDQPRHAKVAPVTRPSGVGIASSWVLVASPIPRREL